MGKPIKLPKLVHLLFTIMVKIHSNTIRYPHMRNAFYSAVFTLSFFITAHFGQSQNATNQPSVQLIKPREISILAFNSVWTGVNYFAFRNAPIIPKNPIYNKIPGLDNFHRYSLNKNVSLVSDATGILTCLAGAFMVMKQPKNEILAKGMIMGQSLWMSVNMAQTVKQLTLRARPYTRAPGVIPTKKDDFYSFYSGHSAAVASIATSAWLMRNKGNGSLSVNGQKTIPIVCTILGISTALLRIYAGKHYPSDVLCGITTGIGIAYINYRIHEK